MSRESLTAEKRDASGKSPEARRLRRSGKVPGVLYRDGESVSFAADELAMAAVLRHGAQMVDLTLDGDTFISIVKDYQVHPVRGTLQHLDLQEVRMDQKVRVPVPIRLVGEAPGTKGGGVLTQSAHELVVECTASAIPDHVDIDISGLEGGQSLHLSDVAPPEGSSFVDPPETLLMSVSVPRGARSTGAAAAENVGEEGTEASTSDTGEAGGDSAGEAPAGE